VLKVDPLSNTQHYWYNAQTSGTLLASNTNSHTFTKTGGGTESVWVEARVNSVPMPRYKIDIETGTNCGNTPSGCLSTGTLVWKEDFDSYGNAATQNRAPTPGWTGTKTTYNYETTTNLGFLLPRVGYYALLNGNIGSPSGSIVWTHYPLHDHTSPTDNTKGYFLNFDANADPGQFYEFDMNGLCSGKELMFSAWLMNINPTTYNHAKPIVEFVIRDPSNNVLAVFNTGEIDRTASPTWVNYAFSFNVPASVTAVKVEFINAQQNGAAAQGNDVSIDDIEVRLCVPEVTVSLPSSANETVCEGELVTFTGTYDDDGTFGSSLRAQWIYKAGGDPNVATGWNFLDSPTNGGDPISKTYTIASAAVGNTGYYRMVASDPANFGSWNCRAMSKVIHLEVIPSMTTGTIGTAQTICSGIQPAQLNFTTSPPTPIGAYSYQWQQNTGGGWSDIASATNATYQPPALTVTTDYRVKITDSGRPGACQSGTSNAVTITVKPKLALTNSTINLTICSETAFDATPTDGSGNTVPAGTLYSWTVSPTSSSSNVSGQSAASNQTAISQTLFNHTNSPKTVSYNVTTSSDGCAGQTLTVNVTVNPKPSIAAQTVTVCSKANYDLLPAITDIVPSDIRYSWITKTGNINLTGSIANGTDQPAFTQTLTNNTAVTQQIVSTLTPSVTINGLRCTGADFDITLKVDPVDGMTLSSSSLIDPICSGSMVSYTAISATPSVTYSWVRQTNASIAEAVTSGSSNVINETLTSTGATTTTVSYRFTLTNGQCTNIDEVTVDVYGKLDGGTITIAGTAGKKDTVCYNAAPPQLSLSGVAGGKTPYTYQWQSKPLGAPAGDAWTNIGGATTLTHTPATPLTESLMFRVETTDPCGTTHSDTATLVALPSSLLIYPDLRIYTCSLQPTNLSQFIDSLNVTSVSWTPTGVAPVISTDGKIAAGVLQPGATYTYTYAVTNSCVTGVRSKVYLHVLSKNKDFNLRADTVAVCHLYANNLQINRIFGLDDGGTITHDGGAGVNPYLVSSVSPSKYAGALIFNGKDAYAAGVLSTINYHGDTNAKAITFTYTTASGGCLNGKTYKVTVVLTTNL
jgi:hypothetical protein